MKRLIFLSLVMIITSYIATAQTNNFYADNGNIYWQKIYESEADLVALLTNTGRFEQIKDINGIISAQMIPCEVELNGRSRGMTPMYLLSSNITCFVRIQQKEGRYRVTADSFVFIQNMNTSLSQMGETTSLETYALKRDGTFKPAFFNSDSAAILDEMLSALFTEQNRLSDDW